MRKATWRDVDWAAKQPDDISREVMLLALCCRVPFAVIAHLDVTEYRAILGREDVNAAVMAGADEGWPAQGHG